MASPTTMSQPGLMGPPARPNADLRHPIPDLQSLQGAYIGNIERLEEHAERMSEAGSDLGEEIRRTYTELKRSDSRRSVDGPTPQFSTRSRNVSTSSHANSIVDVNGAARWGGYSPGGYITSPGGSLRSGSGPTSASIQRQRSGSKASRLGQVVHTEDGVVHPGSPQSLRSAPLQLHNHDSPPPQEQQRRVSSFTRIYDEIANGLPDDLRNSVILGQPLDHADERHTGQSQYHYASHHDFPDRPATAASTDTTHQARTLWQDFDGVHCPHTVMEEEPIPNDEGHNRHSSIPSFIMRANADPPPLGVPPPDDSMVFYPAPVPKMLNLPKRLSQMPPTIVQAKRRTQLLESMQHESRKSAFLGDIQEAPKPNIQNGRQSMMGLPPQLRASAYFDQPAPTQEFAVKGDSAEVTLDSILDASARAPVSAFTNHPFAGHVGNEVYGPEHRRKPSKLPEIPPTLEQTKRRSSFNLLDTKRNSSGDPLNKLKKRNSSADLNMLIVKESDDRMSLGDELDERDANTRGPPIDDELTPTRRSFEDENSRRREDEYDEEAIQEEEQEEIFTGAPTTLLAELQLRKAKQKTRNLNYATLVDQGMTSHRTLLEMDDDAEKEKQKRLKKKVHLAWEVQAESDDSDDDVPLGVLYKQQTHAWDKPLGLIAQRELEDHEPLSKRRNRLRGVDSNHPSSNKRGPQYLHANSSIPTLAVPGAESDEEREGETLGERMRRLRDKQTLESALGDDVRKSTVSGDFAAEMLSKLGVADEKKDTPHPTPSPGPEGEEETLGQRRARLQAEAAARGETPSTSPRPALRSSMSLADILSANPIDTTNAGRSVSTEQLVSALPQGSLLHQNVIAEERRKTQRLTQNMRSSSFAGNLDPLLRNMDTAKQNDDDIPLASKIQAYKDKMSGGMRGGAHMSSTDASSQRQSFMPQMGMNGGMGMGMPMGMMSQPNLMNPNPMMGGMGMMGMQYPQQNPGLRSLPMNMNMGMGLNMNMNMNMNMPMGGMNMGMGMPMNGMPMGAMGMGMGGMGGMNMQQPMVLPPMDPRQRDQIDRWMQGVRN